MADILADGKPRATTCETQNAAKSLLKRLRHAAALQEAQVTARINQDGDAWTLTVEITKRKATE